MKQEYKYVIDFRNVEDFRNIHPIIAESLEFPDYYGGNLDALNDCLTEQLLSGTTQITIYGLEQLGRFNGYDKKILEVFISVKHSFKNKYSKDFVVTIVKDDGSIEVLPDELPTINFNLDFSDAMTEDDVISEFVRAFGFDNEATKNFADLWHYLLLNLTLKISIVEVRGIEKLKSIGDTYDTTLKILSGIKENWNNEYSDRIFITIVHENGERENLE